MSIQHHIDTTRNELTIRVFDRFDFQVTRSFREAYRDQVLPSGRYIVDLSQTRYMDSAALGMLLLLREHATGQAATVTIRGVNEDLKRVLTIARFEQLFELT